MEVQNHGTQVSQVAKDKTATVDGNHGKAVSEVASSNKSIRAQSRDLMNAAVLSAQEDVSLSAGDQPMALLYRAAIEAINEELAPTLGENAIQNAANSDVDYSPEATAGRIVDFATQFFSIYQQQNQQLSYEDQLNGFLDVIGSAIDSGFNEARDILDNLQVLDGDIADGVDSTYDFVQQGLEKFLQDMLANQQQESESSDI